jgi:hypothetical protein
LDEAVVVVVVVVVVLAVLVVLVVVDEYQSLLLFQWCFLVLEK